MGFLWLHGGDQNVDLDGQHCQVQKKVSKQPAPSKQVGVVFGILVSLICRGMILGCFWLDDFGVEFLLGGLGNHAKVDDMRFPWEHPPVESDMSEFFSWKGPMKPYMNAKLHLEYWR